MTEYAHKPQPIVRCTLRDSHESIAIYASVAEQSKGVNFRILDLNIPEQRSAAVAGFDELSHIVTTGGVFSIAKAEERGQGVMQYSGTAKDVGEFVRVAYEASEAASAEAKTAG